MTVLPLPFRHCEREEGKQGMIMKPHPDLLGEACSASKHPPIIAESEAAGSKGARCSYFKGSLISAGPLAISIPL